MRQGFEIQTSEQLLVDARFEFGIPRLRLRLLS
jgi:hypothetical protein